MASNETPTLTLVPESAVGETDEILDDLFEAVSRYRAGHFKAAIRAAADAINTIASVHSLNGGGWY